MDYQFDHKEFERVFEDYFGRAPTEGVTGMYEAVSDNLLMAYRAGQKGECLTDIFPFMKMIGTSF